MLKKDDSNSKRIYQKPKRFFEDSGTVNPEEAYYVPLENVTNRKKSPYLPQDRAAKPHFLRVRRKTGSGKLFFKKEIIYLSLRFPTFFFLFFLQYYFPSTRMISLMVGIFFFCSFPASFSPVSSASSNTCSIFSDDTLSNWKTITR